MGRALLIALLLMHSSISQSQKFLFDFSLNAKMRNYYLNVNRAESMIIKGQTDSAMIYYTAAFSGNKKPLFKDLYNAFIAAVEVGKNKEALILYEKLRNLGCSEKDFPVISKVTNFLKTNEQRIRLYKPRIIHNRKLIAALNKLFTKDQSHRILGAYEKNRNEMRIDDSTNGIALMKLIEKYGFPNEYDIGIQSNDLLSHQFYLIIWHQGTNRQTNFTKVLLEAINKGKIEPYAAAFLIDKYYGDPVFSSEGITHIKYDAEKIDSCCYVLDFNKVSPNYRPRIDQYNQMRAKIGIESLEQTQHKIIFKYINQSVYLFPQYQWGGHNVFKVNSKNFFDQFPFGKMKKITHDINNK